jgi:hypothetical protein
MPTPGEALRELADHGLGSTDGGWIAVREVKDAHST